MENGCSASVHDRVVMTLENDELDFKHGDYVASDLQPAAPCCTINALTCASLHRLYDVRPVW